MQKIFENIMQNERTGAITIMIIVSITLLFILDKVASIKKRNRELEEKAIWNENFLKHQGERIVKLCEQHHVLLKNLSQLPEFKKIPIERLEEFINKKVEYSRIKEEINY